MSEFFFHASPNFSRYVKVDWERVEDEVEEVKEELGKYCNSSTVREMSAQAKLIVQRNALTATGFATGFFLGIAS